MLDRTLLHPPIKEAILEVLFTFPSEINLKRLRSFAAYIPGFPVQESLIEMSSKLGVGETESKLIREQIGTVYFSEDKNSSMQIRTNGFSFSILNQTYTSWNTFQPLAFKYLEMYIDYFEPQSIKRYSLRFINELITPNFQDLSSFLRLMPPYASIGYPLGPALLRMEVKNAEIDSTGIITELIPSGSEPQGRAYLDIDVIKIPQSHENLFELDNLATNFELLRSFKNDLFFNSITELALQTYNQ